MKPDIAILAGGCFWGMQDLLRKLKGVVSTEVGYTGGRNDNPTYQYHPGHAEAVRVIYSPDVLSYRELLKYFFRIHDPTTIRQQGNDTGSSYRSAIFYTSESQQAEAEQLIREMDASGRWPGVVVTEVEQAAEFWTAEPEHQDYLVRNPGGYTCHFERPDWTLPE
ncbi:TPA: peptide-methionine (S)-S-oxide reductase MsrA [Enterobacter roggenkampii]|nr:peptide-methionine (S)-S-oxide reductase MsrA [Enterobacter roggenkampii]